MEEPVTLPLEGGLRVAGLESPVPFAPACDRCQLILLTVSPLDKRHERDVLWQLVLLLAVSGCAFPLEVYLLLYGRMRSRPDVL